RTNLLQPLFGALADLLRLRLARCYLPPDRTDRYLGKSGRDGDVRNRRGWPRRAVISICRGPVDQGGQVDNALPGADMDEGLATASRGGLKRRLGLAGRARPLRQHCEGDRREAAKAITKLWRMG